LNLDICPVGDDATTTVTTMLSHGPEPRADLVVAGPGVASEARIPVPITEIGAITARSPLAEGRRILRLEIQVPNPLIADGIVLVDTPAWAGMEVHMRQACSAWCPPPIEATANRRSCALSSPSDSACSESGWPSR
jgi:hypothetical protein